MEAEIEVHPLRLVVELNEAEETSAGTERVLKAAGGLNGGELSRRETRARYRISRSDDHVTTATKRRFELRTGAVSIV